MAGKGTPPKTNAQPVCVHSAGRSAASYIMDDVSQVPVYDDYLYRDPEYSWDNYIYPEGHTQA